MKVFVLGGGGRISRESALDMARFTDASEIEKITIGDFDEKAAQEVVGIIDDPRVDWVKIDLTQHDEAVAIMKDYDLVMDGTSIPMNVMSTKAIADAGCHCINLNGLSHEEQFSDIFEKNGKVCIAGFGMTPGTTQMMTMHAANQLDTVEEIRISHGAYRPFAFSKAIAKTTCVEYDPADPTRLVYEDGKFIQVPPFSRPKMIELPEPYGVGEEYIIPHVETQTLPTVKSLQDKGLRLVEVRGKWPDQNMMLVRACYEYGILRNEPITINGKEIGVMDALCEYLLNSKEGTTTALYGYALHIDVIGTKDGKKVQHILTHTHPASDGSVPEWAGLRSYTKNVGIPMSVGALCILRGQVNGVGFQIPENAFDPDLIIAELAKRDMIVHEKINYLD